MTTYGCPKVCAACGYLTLGPDLCYFCRPLVAEIFPEFSSSPAGETDITFAQPTDSIQLSGRAAPDKSADCGHEINHPPDIDWGISAIPL